MAEQAMVIEVDPASLQKNRAASHTGKARKSFPKSRTAVPTNQPLPQKTHPKATNPPMVSIPSRHLGSMEATRTNTTPASSSSARIPSITVRPVSHPSQPSIILQPGSSDASSASIATAAKQPTSTSGGSSANSALAVNSMQTVGPEAGFATGGLLLTFNRTLPPFTAATPSSAASSTPACLSKSDSGTIASQLSTKTQQIADMVPVVSIY